MKNYAQALYRGGSLRLRDLSRWGKMVKDHRCPATVSGNAIPSPPIEPEEKGLFGANHSFLFQRAKSATSQCFAESGMGRRRE